MGTVYAVTAFVVATFPVGCVFHRIAQDERLMGRISFAIVVAMIAMLASSIVTGDLLRFAPGDAEYESCGAYPVC